MGAPATSTGDRSSVEEAVEKHRRCLWVDGASVPLSVGVEGLDEVV